MSNLYFINLTPCVPLSTLGEGGREEKEGAEPPLGLPYLNPCYLLDS